jgi:hypothetical protein
MILVHLTSQCLTSGDCFVSIKLISSLIVKYYYSMLRSNCASLHKVSSAANINRSIQLWFALQVLTEPMLPVRTAKLILSSLYLDWGDTCLSVLFTDTRIILCVRHECVTIHDHGCFFYFSAIWVISFCSQLWKWRQYIPPKHYGWTLKTLLHVHSLLGNGLANEFPRRQILGKQSVARLRNNSDNKSVFSVVRAISSAK